MASQLKNILNFVVPAGGAVALPHGLNWQGRPVVPDLIMPSEASSVLTFTADDENVTATNPGSQEAGMTVLVESWHTLERSFGDIANTELSPQPFVVAGASDDGPTYGLGPTNPGILQPAFVDPPARITIYAAPGGSDVDGDGSVGNPYATFLRAHRDVPSIVPPGVGYDVDITDIDEDLPDDFELPAWKSAEENDYDPAHPFFLYNAAVQIIATPRVMTLPNGEATVPIADLNLGLTVTLDGSTLLLLFFDTVRNSWANNALKGKILSQDGHLTPAAVAGTIFASTPQTLLVSMTVAPTADFTIREPSATLRVDSVPSASGDRGGLNAYNCDSLAFQGIRILQRSSPAQSFGLVCVGAGQVVIQMCELQNAQVSSTSQNMTKMFNNWIYGERFRASELLACVNVLFDGIDQFALLNMRLLQLNRCGVFGENTGGTLQWQAQAPGTARFGEAVSAKIENTIIQDITAGGTPDGFRFNGGTCEMVNVSVDGCGRDGVRAEDGMGYLRMYNVRSVTPNGGLGVRVNDGMIVRVNTATSAAVTSPLTGAGGDMQVGGQAVRTWADFIAAIPPSGRAQFNEYDIEDPPLTGTSGSRLFQR